MELFYNIYKIELFYNSDKINNINGIVYCVDTTPLMPSS